jgi:hypothetical protein
MTFSETCIIAENYIKLRNDDLLAKGYNFIYGINEMKEYYSCYYFGFKLLDADGSEYTGDPMGGAPGFIVSKEDRKAQTITFGMWGKLKATEEELRKLHSNLFEVKKGYEPFDSLKNCYNLNSNQWAIIKKAIDEGPLRKATVISLYEMINGRLNMLPGLH